jgi:hypothetical protein
MCFLKEQFLDGHKLKRKPMKGETHLPYKGSVVL